MVSPAAMNYTATLLGSALSKVLEKYAISKWQTTADNRNLVRGAIAGVGAGVGLLKVARPNIPVPEWASLGATALGGGQLSELLIGPEGLLSQPATAAQISAPSSAPQTQALIQNMRKQVDLLKAENEQLRNQLKAMREAELTPVARPRPGYSAMRDVEVESVAPATTATSLNAKEMEKIMGFI